MAKESQLHAQTYRQVTDLVESYHERLNELDAQIAKLQQDRAVVRTTLMAEVHSGAIKLPPDAIGHLAAGCW